MGSKIITKTDRAMEDRMLAASSTGDSERADVLVYVFPFGTVRADDVEAKQVDPQARKARFVCRAKRDLLQAENAERPLVHLRLPRGCDRQSV